MSKARPVDMARESNVFARTGTLRRATEIGRVPVKHYFDAVPMRECAPQQFDFLQGVVRDEDFATGLKQQDALSTTSRECALFGRNEEGGQVFHAWVEKIMQTEDDQLQCLFDHD